jgi:hypothetical protein
MLLPGSLFKVKKEEAGVLVNSIPALPGLITYLPVPSLFIWYFLASCLYNAWYYQIVKCILKIVAGCCCKQQRQHCVNHTMAQSYPCGAECDHAGYPAQKAAWQWQMRNIGSTQNGFDNNSEAMLQHTAGKHPVI